MSKTKLSKFVVLVTGLLLCISINNNRNYLNVSAASTTLEDLKIVDIAAGTDHNLALDQYGSLWAWGKNDFGQLGDGTTNNSTVPIQIMKGHKFKKVSAGNNCSAAIDENNVLYGWGSEANPLGVQNNTPTPFENNSIYHVLCGETNTLSSPLNDFEYFGYFKIDDKIIYPTYLDTKRAIMLDLAKTGISHYSKNLCYYPTYKGGTFYSSNIKVAGIINNTLYEDNFLDCSALTYAVFYCPSQSYIQDLFIGLEENCFVVKKDKTVEHLVSSGKAHGGITLPNIYKEINISNLTNVVKCEIRKCFDTDSGLAFFVDEFGQCYSVGDNGGIYNLLGSNSTIGSIFSADPILVDLNAKITKVSCGKNHVLALDNNGKVYAWGDNAYGQLATGDFSNKTTPTIIYNFDESKSFEIIAISGETNEGSFSQYNSSSYSLIEEPSKGQLLLNENSGEYTYTPSTGEYGDDYCVIQISYNGLIVTYPVYIYIDRKPIFTGGTPSLNLECGQTINGEAHAVDMDNDTLIYSLKTEPNKGTLILNSETGTFTYTARNDVAGGDSFVINVSDGYCSVDYPITVHVHSLITFDDNTNIQIDMNNTNSYSGNINALDIDGDTLSYSIFRNGSKGTATIDDNGNYTYTANGNYFGEDSFVIRVDDGYKPLDVTYNVCIYAVSDFGTSLLNKIRKGATFNGNISTNAKGIEPIYSILEQPTNGSVTINSATGAYQYVPNANTSGDDSFIVLVNYVYGQYTLTIHVYQNTKPNDTLVATDIITRMNEAYSGSSQCLDLDDDTLTYSINEQPNKGSLTLDYSTGSYRYNPYNNVAGDDSFKIDVSDGIDTITILYNVHIESEIEIASEIYKTISQNTSLNGNANAIDKDGDPLTYSIASSASHGACNIDSLTGDYVYVPFNNYYGNDTFVIKVSDGVLDKLCTVNVFVNRKPISNQMIIDLVTKGISATGTAQCNDPDGDPLTYTIIQEPSKGSAIVDTNTGAFAYTPFLNAAGNDTFRIKASDGTDDIIIAINVHNETDVTLDNQTTRIVVNQGKSTIGQVYATDLDGDVLTYSIVNYPNKGTVNINASTGSWTYYSLKDSQGTDTFSIKVTDGNSEAVINYDLIINTPAVFGEDGYSFNTNQNNDYVGQVTALDGDGDQLTFSIVSQGQKGTTTIDPSTGRYLYSPRQGEAGNDTFVIGVSDGNFVSEVQVKVHIESEITIPHSTITLSVNKNGIVTGNVNASDKDGDALTYAIYKQGSKGNATIMGDGGFSYFANEGAGDDTFVISVSDDVHTNYVTVYVHISSEPHFEESSISISVPQNGQVDGRVHGYDEDGDALLYEVTQNPQNGVVNLNSSNGSFTYSAFSNSTASKDIFVISVTDGTSISYVTVNVVINNAPSVSDGSLTVAQGGQGAGQIEARDPENDKLSYEVYSQGTHGNVRINSATGSYTYTTTDKAFSGVDSFTISVSDGYSTVNVVISVNIIKNTKPISKGLSLEVKSGKSVSGQLSVKDNEGDNLQYSITSQGVKGNAYIDERTGEFKYSALKDTEGYDCFIVTVSDGFNTSSYLVEVNITFEDSNNSWAIPTTAILSVVAVAAVSAMIFFLIRAKKKR